MGQCRCLLVTTSGTRSDLKKMNYRRSTRSRNLLFKGQISDSDMATEQEIPISSLILWLGQRWSLICTCIAPCLDPTGKGIRDNWKIGTSTTLQLVALWILLHSSQNKAWAQQCIPCYVSGVIEMHCGGFICSGTGPTNLNTTLSLKEMYNDFSGFPCDPGSRSNDPAWIIFDFGMGFSHIATKSIGKMKYTTKIM